MAKRALIAVAGGALSAVAWLSVTMGVPGGLLLSYFAPLPLLWVGLTSGAAMVMLAGMAGAIAAGVIGGLPAAGTYLGVHALPAAIVVALALLHRPAARTNGAAYRAANGAHTGSQGAGVAFMAPGIILAGLAVTAALGLVILGVVEGGDQGESIEAGVRAFVESFVITPAGGGGEGEAEVTPMAVLAPLAPVFLGFLAMAWQIMVVLNAVLAQWLAVKAGSALRPSPRWAATWLPDWLSWLMVGAAALALATSGDFAYLAQNATVALSVPFFFVGLAVVHRLAARAAARRLLLGVFYVMLVIMFLVMVVAVTGLGIVDQWLKPQRRGGGGIVKRRE